jgi:hypothetical protein
VNVHDYVRDSEGQLWLVASLVSNAEGEFAVLLPAKPLIRFHVDPRDERKRVPVGDLTKLDEITVTETL